MSADFGSAYSNITTVGYQLFDILGSIVTTRTTTGIVGLGNGVYQALVTFPDKFRGTIYWDTVPSGTIYAVESINPEYAEYMDEYLSNVVQNVTGAAGAIVQSSLTSQGYTTDRAVSIDAILNNTSSGSIGEDVWLYTQRSITDKSGFSLTLGEHLSIVTDATSALTNQGYTSTRASYLDTLNNLVHNIWNAATRSLTEFLFNVTVETNNDKTGYSLNLAQSIAAAQTGGTVGRALQIARAQGRGNWILNTGANTLTLYDTDGTTVVAVFALSPVGGPYKDRSTTNE